MMKRIAVATVLAVGLLGAASVQASAASFSVADCVTARDNVRLGIGSNGEGRNYNNYIVQHCSSL